MTIPFWLGVLFGGMMGFVTCAIFSARQYEKGYHDALTKKLGDVEITVKVGE